MFSCNKVTAQILLPIKNDLGKYKLNFLLGNKPSYILERKIDPNKLIDSLQLFIAYSTSPKYDAERNYRLSSLLLGINGSNARKKDLVKVNHNDIYQLVSQKYVGMLGYSLNKVNLAFNGQTSRVNKNLRQRYNEKDLRIAAYLGMPSCPKDSINHQFYTGQLQMSFITSQTQYWNLNIDQSEIDIYCRYGLALNLNAYSLPNDLAELLGPIEQKYLFQWNNALFLGGIGIKVFLQIQLGNDRGREAGNITFFSFWDAFFIKDEKENKYLIKSISPLINLQYNFPIALLKNYGKFSYTHYTPIE